MTPNTHDVVIVGGGPVGCVAALAFAQRSASVLLLEANSRAAARLAGEWLHPAAVSALGSLGVSLDVDYPSGRGFVVFPEDGSEEVVLPYADGLRGASLRHERLVAILRDAVAAQSIDFRDGERARDALPGRVTIDKKRGGSAVVSSDRVVLACGRRGVGVAPSGTAVSKMAGVAVRGVTLPHEGFGHVFLGGLGPVLAYRIGADEVRICLDVPLSFAGGGDRFARLYDAYSPCLPTQLRAALHGAFRNGEVEFAVNQVRKRRSFGEARLALVGDAVGHHHPLTAVGLSLGFDDALSLASATSFDAHRDHRLEASAVPELLAIALYDVFSGRSEAMTELRRAVVTSWRQSDEERARTMRLLSTAETRRAVFGASLARVVGTAGASVVRSAARGGGARRAATIGAELAASFQGWMAGEPIARTSAPEPRSLSPRTKVKHSETIRALGLGSRALVGLQNEDGSWEGEVVWCPMLAAEYVLTCHVIGRPITGGRRDKLVLHFRRTQSPEGLWTLSEGCEPSLFVTTLVYVASRVLGVEARDPMLAAAREFFRSERVESIPTWGKFWLSMLSLYRWEGVNPVIPELFALPKWLPVHPSRYYCHTRLIYMAMAALYGDRFTMPEDALTRALRDELYGGRFGAIDFRAARGSLRPGDLWEAPSFALRRAYDVLRFVDRAVGRSSTRAAIIAELRESLRWELMATAYTGISPVTGLLSILALWAADHDDPDVARCLERSECWIWEDDRDGTRVAGARSAIWDTSFAVQALVRIPHDAATRAALERGVQYLAEQQIRDVFPLHAKYDRVDPSGGYPVSFGWSGWPVSDCTAEALVARLEAGDAVDDEDVAMGARFILQMQNSSGGFGSYEPRRVPFSLEWMNPAEMFGDSMAEADYVECTASCLVALRTIARKRPALLRRAALSEIPRAIARGERAIRRLQLPSGAWDGAWGVRFTYGTWFGIRGLRAAGAGPGDPAIRRARAWLESVQLADGGWGERHSPHSPEYESTTHGRVVQTAWAMLGLLAADHENFAVLERGARFLVRAHLGSGEWPREEPPGIFFRTALLDYTLYRSYFPLLALAEFEERRQRRELLLSPERVLEEELAS